ncbi:Uncharacterised protein [Mycobacterium tuberculosis]|uniref:Uncharacterized protein n=1 Tax=Mycobacterium tuberculosis TaxID=1773 RepID=A0A0U0SGU4_MYCTX|nr:Uncharacterised protein [Mycobacterium tuberculosis]COW74158.1 Uncharacterised protein [Mycobacterium tuberculosis]
MSTVRRLVSVSPVVLDAGAGIRIRDAWTSRVVNGTTVTEAVESNRSFWMTATGVACRCRHHAPPRCGCRRAARQVASSQSTDTASTKA